MDNRDRLYINGSWVPSTSTDTLDVIDSTTEAVMGKIPNGTADDVDQAVRAAAAAFPAWSATPVDERAKYLDRLAEGLGARMDEIGALDLARGRHAGEARRWCAGRAPGRRGGRRREERA